MMWKLRHAGALALAIVVVNAALGGGLAHAASPPEFGSAMKAIGRAFDATYNASLSGGNVSLLVGKLNLALGMVREAQGSNATDPSLATSALSNATLLALQVSAEAPDAGRLGAEARANQAYESAGSLAVIITVALTLYLFGDRIHRRLWLLAYGRFSVRPVDE